MMIVFTFSPTHCFLPRRLADNYFLLYFFLLSPPTPLSWCSFLSCSSLTRALCLVQSRFRENDARHLCRVVILCVQHCHDMGIVHRDLRPEHLLLNSRNEDASLKLTGFDYARSLPRDGHGGRRGLLVSESYVTAEYAAPEVLRSTPHGTVSAAVYLVLLRPCVDGVGYVVVMMVCCQVQVSVMLPGGDGTFVCRFLFSARVSPHTRISVHCCLSS